MLPFRNSMLTALRLYGRCSVMALFLVCRFFLFSLLVNDGTLSESCSKSERDRYGHIASAQILLETDPNDSFNHQMTSNEAFSASLSESRLTRRATRTTSMKRHLLKGNVKIPRVMKCCCGNGSPQKKSSYTVRLKSPNCSHLESVKARVSETCPAEKIQRRISRALSRTSTFGRKQLERMTRQRKKFIIQPKDSNNVISTFIDCIARVKFFRWSREIWRTPEIIPDTPFVIASAEDPASSDADSLNMSPGRVWHSKEEFQPIDVWDAEPPTNMSPTRQAANGNNVNDNNVNDTNDNNDDDDDDENDEGEFIDARGKLRTKDKWPIVYRKEYNVDLSGYSWFIKDLTYDIRKWGNTFEYLKKEKMLSDDLVTVPDEADTEILPKIHTPEYLKSLQKSKTIAKIIGMDNAAKLWATTLDARLLKPMRYQTGGSILAGELAIHRKWAINIGGGFHHASADKGGNYCPYADISLMIKWLFQFYPKKVKTAMIVDLDAHQGNGHETDFMKEARVFIMDMYTKDIEPNDGPSKEAIRCQVELEPQTSDDEYLALVEKNLKCSLDEFHPSIVVYNAGTDIYFEDTLGNLAISEQGIIARDEIVFREVRGRGIPIVMLTSGGYTQKAAGITARSILNLRDKGLISM